MVIWSTDLNQATVSSPTTAETSQYYKIHILTLVEVDLTFPEHKLYPLQVTRFRFRQQLSNMNCSFARTFYIPYIVCYFTLCRFVLRTSIFITTELVLRKASSLHANVRLSDAVKRTTIYLGFDFYFAYIL